MPGKDGETHRARVEGLLKRNMTPERREELMEELFVPEFPQAMSYVWKAFYRLRNRIGTDGMGNPQPITWGDFDAFNRLSGLRLTPWEIELIEELDSAYLSERARASSS